MGGDIGIIGGADTPTFIFVAKTLLLDVILGILAVIAIVFALGLAILLFKKRKKYDENKKDRRKR